MKVTVSKIWIFWIILIFVVWLLIPFAVIPKPFELLETLYFLGTVQSRENLFYNTLVTLKLQIFGIALSLLFSLLFSYGGVLKIRIKGKPVQLFLPLTRILELLRYIPIVGFTVIFYHFFAIGFWMKVAMFTTGLTFFLTTSIGAAIDAAPRMKYELAKSLGYSEWQAFVSAVFIPTMPNVLESLRQNAAMGWLMIAAVETFSRTEGGIGAMLYIYSGSNFFNKVYSYLFVIAVLAFLEDILIKFLIGYFFPYTKIKERG